MFGEDQIVELQPCGTRMEWHEVLDVPHSVGKL